MKPSLQKFNRPAISIICLAFAFTLLAGWRATTVRAETDDIVVPPINIPLAGAPISISTGDVNSDTAPDIFTYNVNSPFTIIFSNVAGGFMPPYSVSGVGGQFVELKDVNNNGKPDIVVIESGLPPFSPHIVNVRLGDGLGGFAAPVVSNFGSATHTLKDIAFADFNNDNFLDIVISTSGPGQTVPGGNVFVILSNGAGGFVPSASPAIHSRGADVAAGDFNQDNKADIAVRSLGAGCAEVVCQAAVQILLGDGTGQFPTPHISSGVSSQLSEFVVGDANNDGKQDLIGVQASAVVTFLGTGAGNFVGGGSSANITSGLFGTAVADFNRDGKLDVALVKDLLYIAYGNGAGGFSRVQPFPVNEFPVDLAIGDFNRNNIPDVAVANTSPSNNVSVFMDIGFSAPPRTQFDFDGDFKADIAVYRDGNTPNAPSYWHILQSSNNTYLGVQHGANGDKPVPADYDNDGKADIAVWRPSTGTWFTSTNAAINYGAFQWGLNGDIPIPGDFDGDGKADHAVYRPGNFTWYVRRSSDGVFQQQRFGTSAVKPLLGDFDGDNTTDFAYYSPGATALANSLWSVIQSSNGVILSAQFGRGEDKPVPADYDGDGKTNFAVYRASAFTWYTSLNPSINYGATVWGAEGDVPAPADYDRDGKADLAVFRPGSSAWYILQSSNGGVVGRQWGLPGDKPVPSSFIP
ncbi:MAG: VCBS repeat-containing protein [Pyrinomonadaceae bacterium]|nr:VCBS repeat-containing protein [Pyrinomonadaceae bacterium]